MTVTYALKPDGILDGRVVRDTQTIAHFSLTANGRLQRLWAVAAGVTQHDLMMARMRLRGLDLRWNHQDDNNRIELSSGC